ncbi:MAG: TIGR03943 family protein [Mycobacterium sp.]|nr:TIGR03943 family protein [Mycobacterium sp.]
MSRETENALLLMVGISTALVAASGTFTRYVKPGLLPWLVISAAALIALAVVSIVRELRHPRPNDHAGHDGHSHGGGVVWALGLPVVVLSFVVPPALSPRAATATVLNVSNDVLRHAYPPLSAGAAPELSLPATVTRATYDSAGSLNGRTITVVGFTYKDGPTTDLARVTITCCAADARLYRLQLTGPAAVHVSALPENTWVRVQGMASPPKQDDPQSVPTLEVSSADQISVPADQYAYLTQ